MDNNRIVYATSTVSARAHASALVGIMRVANALHHNDPCPECGYIVTSLADHQDGCSWARGAK